MVQKKYNILFLSSWYPNRVQPTLGDFVQRHAEAVALHSNIAALFVCSDINCKEKFEIEELHENGIFTVKVYYKKVSKHFPLISQFQKASRYFRAHEIGLKIINEKFGKIDLVHHNILYPSGVIAWYLKKIKNIPYISTEHWTGYLPSDGSYKGFVRKFLTKRIGNNANYLTPVSNDLKKAMIGHGFKSNYEIVTNVVDTKLFYPKKNKIANSKTRMIHISTLDDAQKNISGILKSVGELKKTRNDFELFFVGDHPEKNKLEKLADELGLLNTSVFFLGYKFKEELAEILRQSDFFVLFSNYENLPCVLIESLASGVPVIATDTGGIAEHISKEMGIVISPQDENALTNAMEKMLNDHKNYSADYLSNYANDHFSYESVGLQFQKIYNKILTNG